MAEKRRTWHKADYEKKQEERIDNEEADILSFKFKSLEKQRNERKSRERKSFDGERKSFGRDRKSFGDKEERPFKKGGKPFRQKETRADRQSMRKNFFNKGGNED